MKAPPRRPSGSCPPPPAASGSGPTLAMCCSTSPARASWCRPRSGRWRRFRWRGGRRWAIADEPVASTADFLQKRHSRDIEIVPLSFIVFLNHPIPEITVTLQAINYLAKTVELEQLTVGYFHVSMAPPIETVRGTEYELSPQVSRQVYCRRPLIDSEIRAFQKMPLTCRLLATIHMSAKDMAGRHSVSLSNHSLVIDGWGDGRASILRGEEQFEFFAKLRA
jgi:hypothetical protein